jgi:hypothetical protein
MDTQNVTHTAAISISAHDAHTVARLSAQHARGANEPNLKRMAATNIERTHPDARTWFI